MLQNSEGKRVPQVTFRTRQGANWVDVTTDDIFAGKTVVVFSLPGAFTPTCSSAHVPRYNELADVFAENGVDEIVCVSVNDAFVMNAWKDEQGADRIRFLPDGNGAFTEKMGMLVDKRGLGFGARSWRYSMLVKDGMVEKMFIEPEVEGDPYGVSDADTMLAYINPNALAPPDIFMLTRPTCSHCARARELLEKHSLPYAEVTATPRMLRAVSHTPTTPRVFVNGELIGGTDELAEYLERTAQLRRAS